MATIEQLLGAAKKLGLQGDHKRANEIYNALLSEYRSRPDAMIELVQSASGLGQSRLALRFATHALESSPNHVGLINLAGATAYGCNEYSTAADHFRRMAELNPSNTDALNNWGLSLLNSGQPAEALQVLLRAQELNPRDVDVTYNCGLACQKLEQIRKATEYYQRAIEIAPTYYSAHYNLANIHLHHNSLEKAIAGFERAIQLKPTAEAYNNLGVAWKKLNNLPRAVECYERALQLNANYSDALVNLGLALKQSSQLPQAIEVLQAATERDPSNARAFCGLADALRDQKELLRAVECYNRAFMIDNSYTEALSKLTFLLQQICRWDRLDALAQQQIERVNNDLHDASAIPPFLFLSLPCVTSPRQQLTCAQTWVKQRLAAPVAQLPVNYPVSNVNLTRDSQDSRKLRVGYLSADFREHPVAGLAVELFEKHDRTRLEVYGYSFGRDDGSPLRSRIENAFDSFRDVTQNSFAETVECIQRDQIDILVDLMGFTQHCRPQILAARAAPIQVNYLGFPATMGANFIDYIIVDDFVVPDEAKQHFTEQLVYMPHCYMVGDSQRAVDCPAPSREQCGLPENGFVFCSFNNSYKFTPALFSVWMRILSAVEDSVLWLREANPLVAANLRAEAKKHAVSPERLVFAQRVSIEEHLARHKTADLFLDTFPFNAHSTASDALRAGLPLLTLSGESFASRVAGSLLSGLGMNQLIAGSPEQYEQLAIELAVNPATYSHTRDELHERLRNSSLFAATPFAKHLEDAYMQMWQSQISGAAPHSFRV